MLLPKTGGNMARPRSDVFQRFESKVKRVESGCHEWQSTIKNTGYGGFWHDGKPQTAHCVAYQLYKGEIPKGMVIRHSCDNRKCVNVEHLILGTQADNINDMDGRNRRGFGSKLNLAQIAEIKELIKQRYPQAEIASRYGVTQTAISKIKLGKSKYYKPV